MHDDEGRRLPGEAQLEGTSLVLRPQLVGHLRPGLVEPPDDRLIVIPEHRDLAAQRGEGGDGGEEVPLRLVEVPVQPGHLVVLAVGVVVAAGGAPDLVAGGEHRHAGGEQQRAEKVAHRATPREGDHGVVGRTFGAVVPRAVVVAAVAVVLAVGLVVLLLVGDEVGEGEAVVRGDEADRGEGRPLGEEVTAAHEPGREVAHPRTAHLARRERPRVGEPEVARGVAEAVVPLRPRPRELPGAPAVRADVPGLGDVQHPGEHRVLPQRDEEGVLRVEAEVVTPPERHREVVPEAVDVALLHPVAKGVQHHLPRRGVGEVEGVAASGDVDVTARLVEAVVAGSREAAPAQRRAAGALLGRVVVDDVEQHLDAGGVEQLDHALELTDHLVRVRIARIGRVRGEEADRVVAPVVAQPDLLQVRLVDEGVHRQQLHARHPEPPEVLDRHRVRHPRVGPAQVLGHPRQQPRHLPDVHLVDDPLVAGDRRGSVLAPVEAGVDDDAPRDEGGRVTLRAHRGIPLAGLVDDVPVDLRCVGEFPLDRAGVRVEEELGGVVPVAGGGVPRAVGPEPVARPRPDLRDEPGPPAVPGGRELDGALAPFVVEDAQPHGARLRGEHRGLDAAVDGPDAGGGTVGERSGAGGRHGSQGKQWVRWGT